MRETLLYTLFFFFVIIANMTAITSATKTKDLDNFYQIEIVKGDSLWSIAENYSIHTKFSKQQFVKWVKEKNKLESHVIQPGDLVTIPVTKEQLFHVEQFASGQFSK